LTIPATTNVHQPKRAPNPHQKRAPNPQTSDTPRRVRWVHPKDGFGPLGRFDVEIDRHRLSVTATQHALEHFMLAGIDFLVWDVRRYVNKVTRTRLGNEFQLIAPAHPGATSNDINDALQRPMMMSASLGVGVDMNRAGP